MTHCVGNTQHVISFSLPKNAITLAIGTTATLLATSFNVLLFFHPSQRWLALGSGLLLTNTILAVYSSGHLCQTGTQLNKEKPITDLAIQKRKRSVNPIRPKFYVLPLKLENSNKKNTKSFFYLLQNKPLLSIKPQRKGTPVPLFRCSPERTPLLEDSRSPYSSV